MLALAGCGGNDEGGIGLGDPFSFPFQTIESILPFDSGRLLLLNDNNHPLSAGRNPEQPDDTEAIIIRPEALRDDPTAPAARHRRVLARDDGRSSAPSGGGHPPSRRLDMLA